MMKATEEERIQFVINILEHYKAKKDYSREVYESLPTDNEIKTAVKEESKKQLKETKKPTIAQVHEYITEASNSDLKRLKGLIEKELRLSETAIKEGFEVRK